MSLTVNSLRTALVPLSLALAIGGVGGFIFDWLTMPLAWLIGAMCFTTTAALSGVRMKIPAPLRNAMVMVIGLMMGSSFTPEVLDRAGQWVPSLAMLMVYIIVAGGLLFIILYWKFRYGLATAYFSAAPGGLNDMMIIGSAFGGDERIISLSHSVRILVTVLIIPFWFRFVYDYVPASNAATFGTFSDISYADLAILVACAVVGYAVARLMRITAAQLIGPLVFSAAVHLLGITDAKPPGLAITVAQWIIGAYIGSRFVGVSIRRVADVMATAVFGTVFLVVMAAFFALGLERLTGLPFTTLLLAFSPGGLPEMSLISLSLKADTAFVATHHLARITVIVILVPVVFRLIRGRFGERPGKTLD
ncbi:MAG: AbrB family transcriptional regulator [Rhodospirillales bacterium]|nr:AbrB family transcriptional regulator [Rhodospirillales bacterium]